MHMGHANTYACLSTSKHSQACGYGRSRSNRYHKIDPLVDATVKQTNILADCMVRGIIYYASI